MQASVSENKRVRARASEVQAKKQARMFYLIRLASVNVIEEWCQSNRRWRQRILRWCQNISILIKTSSLTLFISINYWRKTRNMWHVHAYLFLIQRDISSKSNNLRRTIYFIYFNFSIFKSNDLNRFQSFCNQNNVL